MADVNTADIQSLNQALTQLGMGGNAQNQQDVQIRSHALLNQLQKLFVDPDKQIALTPETIPEAISAVRAGIQDKLVSQEDEHGRSQLEMLDAITKEDIEFLVLDRGVTKGRAKGVIRDIYEQNTSGGVINYGAVVTTLLEKAGNKALADSLQRHTPHFLQDMQASVELLKNPEALLGPMEALHGQGFFAAKVDKEALAQLDQSAPLQEAIKIVKAATGVKEPNEHWDTQEQINLKNLTAKLQADPYFGREASAQELSALGVESLSLRPGVMDDGFLALTTLRARNMAAATAPTSSTPQHLFMIAAEPAPASTVFPNPDDALKFVNSLTIMHERGEDILLPADRLGEGQAALTVEMGLRQIAPMLNNMLDEATGGEHGRFVPILIGMFAGDLQHTRVGEIDGANEYFDMQSQASLQSLMTVLSHRQVLNLKTKATETDGQGNTSERTLHPWEYSPEKGREILAKLRNKDHPPSFFNFIKDEKQKKQLEELINSPMLEEWVTSLDALHNRGALANFSLDRGQGQSFPDFTQNLVSREIARLDAVGDPHKNAVKLMDTLVHGYSGHYHLNDMLGAERQIQLFDDPNKTREQRLKEFYKGAREAFLNQNKDMGQKDFENFILPMLLTIDTLPLGSRDQRDQFKEGITKAILESDGDEAKFAKSAGETIDALYKDGKTVERKVDGTITLHPKLFNPALGGEDANFLAAASLNFDGRQMDINDIIAAYEDRDVASTPFYNRRTGIPSDITNAVYLPFKDNEGQVYIAGVEKSANVFTVEKLDVDKLTQYLDPQAYMDKHGADMNEEERAAQQKIIDTYNEHVERYYANATHPDKAYEHMTYLSQFAIPELTKNDPAFALVVNNNLTNNVMGFYRDISNTQEIPTLAATADTLKPQADSLRQRFKDKAEEAKAAEVSMAMPTTSMADMYAAPKTPNTSLPEPGAYEANVIALLADGAQHDVMMVDAEALDILSKYEDDMRGGQKLKIGTFMGAKTRVEHIDVAPNPENMPMVAYFDGWHNPDGNGSGRRGRQDGTLNVVPLDRKMFDPHERSMMLRQDGEGTVAYYRRLKEEYPQTFDLVESRWRRMNKLEMPLKSDDTLLNADLDGFDMLARHTVLRAGQQIQERNLKLPPQGLSHTFVNSNGESPKQSDTAKKENGLKNEFSRGGVGKNDLPNTAPLTPQSTESLPRPSN